MTTFDNIENVIKLFYSGSNYTPEIQECLNNFQSSTQSLNYIWPLLDKNKCNTIRYFAASSLYKIVKKHWDYTYNNILLNVLSILSHDQNNDITNERIMMVLAHVILRTISVDPDLIQKMTHFSSDKHDATNEMGLNRKTTACVLKYIPEEFGSLNLNRVEKNIARSHLHSNVKFVLTFVNNILSSCQSNAIEPDLICRLLACLNAWVSVEDVSLDFAQNLPTMEAIVGKVFPMLNVPVINREAIGFINSLINFPELYKYPNFVKLLIGGTLSLEPLLSDVTYKSPEEITELRTLVCALIEVHGGLLVSLLITHYPTDQSTDLDASTTKLFNTIRQLLSWLLACTETEGFYPLDEQITPTALGVWVAFTDEINDILPRQADLTNVTNEETQIRQDLYVTMWEPLYTRLAVAMLKKLRLPDDFSRWDLESSETFFAFRASELCQDALSAIRNVLKIPKVLQILHDHLIRNIKVHEPSANYLLEFEIVLHILNSLGDNLFQWPPPVLSADTFPNVQTELVKIIHHGILLKFDYLTQNNCSEKVMVHVRRTVLKYIARFAPFLRSAEDPNLLSELLKWVSAEIYTQNTMVPAFEALNVIFESYATEIDQSTSQQIYQLCQNFHQSYYQSPADARGNCIEEIIRQYTCPVLAKIFLEICADSGPEQLITILQSLFAQTIDELNQSSTSDGAFLKDELLRRFKMLTVLDSFLLCVAQRMPLCETENHGVETHYLLSHPSHKQVLLSFVSQVSSSLLKNIETLTRPSEASNRATSTTGHDETVTNILEKSLNILADILQLFPLSPSTFIRDIALFDSFVPAICCHLVESIYAKNPVPLAKANIFDLAKDYVVTFCKCPEYSCGLSQICQKYMAKGIIDVTLTDQSLHCLFNPAEMSVHPSMIVTFFRFISALLQKVAHVLLPQSYEPTDIQRVQRILSLALATIKSTHPNAVVSGLNLTTKLLIKKSDLDPRCLDIIADTSNSTLQPFGPALIATLFYVIFPEKMGPRDNRLYVEATLRPCCELILTLNKSWAVEFKAWLEAYMANFENDHRSQVTKIMLGERKWRRMVEQITYFKTGSLHYSES